MAALSAMGLRSRRARAAASPNIADKLLFVFTAAGGASIVDSFMAVRESECSSQSVADQLIVYPDEMVKTFPGTNIRALDTAPSYRAFLGSTGIPFDQSTFVENHAQHMAVMALQNTSVNHFVAQERSMNGQGINGGKTIAEHIAEVHGQGLALPYINMSGGGFLSGGTDPTLPAYARAETINQAPYFALGTDGMRGMRGAPGSAQPGTPASSSELAAGKALLNRARDIRNQLDDMSAFYQTFQCSPLLSSYRVQREVKALQLEEMDLFSKLFMFGSGDLSVDFGQYGLLENAEALAARDIVTAWPDGDTSKKMDILTDPQVGQVLLSYLAAKDGLSAASVFGPNLSTQLAIIDQQPPLVFDYCHTSHVAGQAVGWSRVLDLVDKLAFLLQTTDTLDGGTMWDRSVIYIATDFGRDKLRTTPGAPMYSIDPDGDGPLQAAPVNTGHHLNNGAVVLSPLIKPGLYGDVDKDTLLTYGFNRNTGLADPAETIRVGDIYSVIADALDAPFSGITDIPALKPA